MSELPEEIVVTLRTTDAPAILEGADEDECEVCEEAIIVSAGTRLSIAQGTYPDYIICSQCATEHIEEDEPTD